MKKIKTFEDACKALKLNPTQVLPIVTGLPMHHRKAILAHAKLVLIAEALNEGWKPDWKNGSWDKYYPWFDMSSGSGLAYRGYDRQLSHSVVGSRLCLKSSKLAEYAGKQFIELYKDYFLM